MKKTIRLALVASLAGLPAAFAAQATAAEVAPGALMLTVEDGTAEDLPVEVPPGYDATGTCSQGLPGTVTLPDGEQRRVMVSAAHCLKGTEGVEGDVASLYVPMEEGNRLIALPDRGEKATFTEGDHPLDPDYWFDTTPDWATADLAPDAEMTRVADSVDQYGRRHGEPVVLTGVRDYRDLEEGEVSFDNLGQPICKDGATSGRTCGIQFMRTRNTLWSTNVGLPGDSGGVNFDPTTGEALGASTQSLLGLMMATQPFDVALEEAYDIPDGQVNERFSLPESTEAHDPMLTTTEYGQRVGDWAQQEMPEQTQQPAEPLTVEDAEQVALGNTMYAVGELRGQAQDAANILTQDPTRVDAVAENAATGAEILGGLAQETAQAYDEALANLVFGEEEE